MSSGDVYGDPIAYFWSRVDKSGGPEACWPWTGRKNSGGYGMLMVGIRWVAAHRFSLALSLGRDPGRFYACHKCHNPACVNPSHLYAGTPKDNVRDMIDAGRQGEASPADAMRKRAYKLTDEAVREMRARSASGESNRDLADRFNVTIQYVWKIVKGKQWRHLEEKLTEPLDE